MTKDSVEKYINSKRCVRGVFDYKSALLFSVETMSTIGFGTRVITNNCITSALLLLIQSIIGIVLPTVITAVIFAKFKSSFNVCSLKFSSKAAITHEDGKYFLRVKASPVDSINGILEEASARGVVVTRSKPIDFEDEEEEDVDLKVISFNIDRRPMMWPTILSAEIQSDSPLHDFNCGIPGADNFELVLVLTGSTVYDGSTVVQRTSFLPSEIVPVAGKFNF